MANVSLEGMSPEAIADLALLAKGLSDNPKTRGQFLGLMKSADPSMSIPEIDIPNNIGAAVKPHLERINKLETEAREREIRDTITARRAKISKDKGLSESEVTEVEKMMVEKGISNHETAAEFYLSQKQSAAPTPSSFSQPAMPKPDLKGMGVNINQWARGEATNAIAELIKGRRAA
jgi:hypothetical protein